MNKSIIKIVTLLLVMSLISNIPSLGAEASSADCTTISPSASAIINIDSLISDVIDVIEDYYYSKDITGSFVADTSFEADIASYLSDKVETQQYVVSLYRTNKQNYSVSVELIDYAPISNSNIISFDFQVLTTFNYIGCDFDSSVSENINIQFDCSKYQIVDLYTPMDYYDEFVRCDQSIESRSGIATEFKLTTSIAANQNKLRDSINTRYVAITSTENNLSTPNNVTRTSALNSTKIVNWARSNFNSNQPSPGNSSVSYFDFSSLSNAYDCTNFVSHALLAGGAKVNDTGLSGIRNSGWYFRNTNNRSKSWAGVNYFYNYMTTNTTSNTAAGDSYMYTHNASWFGLGYVMQFDWDGDGDFNHSTIITKKETSSDGKRAYAYVTGRTGDGQYNNNQSADEMCPTFTPRVLYIYNN